MNTTQEQYAICSALAAAALAARSRLKVIVLRKFANFLWWLKVKLKATRKPRRLLCFLRNLGLG